MPVARDLAKYAPSHLRDWDSGDSGWRLVDGTLCLVDISGFTALSEKLAALGRIGAEELTEVLGRVFGDMLNIASARGGTLLKFGGDALLLLFESEDHAIQAASAAVEMRTALRKSKDIPTSVGRLALRMSQGIHSGEVLLIHAVGSHRELIVAGPTASWVTHMESVASANEIMVSEATQDLLPTSSVSEASGDGGLLRWRIARAVPIILGEVPSISPSDEVSHIPIALRDHLTSGTSDSEHRQATVGFIEVAGTDGLITEHGVDSAASAVQTLVISIMEVADEESVTFLGTDVDTNVFKVILVCGVPASTEDEDGRLLRVARRIADLDTPLSISIGVNRGHVFSGEVGVEERATYTIMGDTVNLAARLMAAAPSGSVYATPTVADRSLSLFETFDVEPLRVKGKSEPVRAISVGEETGSRTLSSDEDGIFVGREEELRILTRAVDEVHDGRGGAFILSGPTGIGKTRLLNEVLGDAACAVVEVRAEPYGTANPYRPFRDPVRQLLGLDPASSEALPGQLSRRLGEIDAALTAFAPLLGDIVNIDAIPTPETEHISGQFRQDRAADILIEALSHVGGDSMVLSFEDAHWADAASSALLARLVKATEEHPWLVIQTSREGTAEGPSVIEIGPLDEDDVKALVYAETESAPLRPDVVDTIVERSGGSPLFAHELLHVIKTTGDADSLPTSLEGVVGTQIDRLEPLARRVLRYVSVLGRSFRRSVARDLIQTQGLQLDAAARSALTGFLDDDGKDRLQFRHAIVRDVAYEGLSFKRRKELHRHAGELVLDQYAGSEESVADILALHFYMADDYDKAWTYCTMAGNRNMERYANIEAATEFEHALDAARRLPDLSDEQWRQVWLSLGDVTERAGDFDASLNAYRRAAHHTGDDNLALAEVQLRMARARERSGAYSLALRDTTRVRSLVNGYASRDADRFRARALSHAALIRQAQQKPRRSLQLALEAAAVAEHAEDDIALARAWRILDWSYVMIGEPEEATFSPRALDLYRRMGDLDSEASILINLGGFAFEIGNWTTALEHYERARAASLKVGNVVHAAHTEANMGEVLVAQGRFSEAKGPLEDARRTYRASGFAEGVIFVDLLLGRMSGASGDFERSVQYLSTAIREADELGIEGWMFEGSIFLAETHISAGSPDRAIDILVTARQASQPEHADFYLPLFSRIYGTALAATGRVDEARTSLRDGAETAQARGDNYQHAMITRSLSVVAPTDVATETLTKANRTLGSLGVVTDMDGAS